MKKLTAIMLSILMVISLTACGGVSKDADKYVAYSITMLGMDMEPSEIYDDEIALLLDDKGKALFSLDGEDYNCKWKMDGDVFVLSQGSDEFKGTKDGDVVTIVDMLNMGLDINFLKEGAQLPVDKSKPAGKYLLSGMNMSGNKMAYVDIEEAQMVMDLDFKEDGTLEMSSNGEVVELGIDYDAKTVDIEGSKSDFTFEDEQFTIISEAEGIKVEMVFTAENSEKWTAIKAEPSAMGLTDGGDNLSSSFVAPGYGAQKTVPVETLSNPSDWYGTVTISNYEGPYASDTRGEHEATATISNDGVSDYFEIYVDGIYEDEDDAIMSYYAEIYDYTFYPIIGEESWIFDIELVEDDRNSFIPTLTNGVLSATYDYVDDDESFTFTYELAMVEGSNVEPVTEDVSGRLTKAQLIEAYQTIEDINLRDRSKLTYEEVVADYMHGVEGEIDVQGEGYVSYIWKAQESDIAQVNFIFQLDEDDGVWGMGSRSIDNME